MPESRTPRRRSRRRGVPPGRAARYVRPGGRSTGSAWEAHGNATVAQVTFEIGDWMLREMEDRGGERGVSAPGGEDLDEVGERAGAARRDDGDRDGARHGRRQLAVEPGTRAVAIDRRQQDLTGAAVDSLSRPLDRIAAGGGASAAGEHVVSRTRLIRWRSLAGALATAERSLAGA